MPFREQSRFAFVLQALERRDFARAEAALSELLERPDLEVADRAFLTNKRGVARIGLGHRDAARSDFAAVLQLSPRHAPALTNLATMLLEDGDVGGAIEGYERAVAADPLYAAAHVNLSVAYKRVGRIADAVRMLRRGHRLEMRASAARSLRVPRR